SKSKGNLVSIDDSREQYGTDAVRMVYFYQNKAGASYAFTMDKLKNFKQFMNKIWNASRFVLMNTEGVEYIEPVFENLRLGLSKDIYTHVTELKKKITKNINEFEFGHATDSLYHEFWHTFCDIYIEKAKQYLLTQKDRETGAIIKEPNVEDKVEMQSIMTYALKEYIKMLHPFIPFITERIWQELPKVEGDHKTLMYSRW